MFLLVSSHVPSPSVESAVLCKLFAHFTLCKHFPVLCLFTVTDDKEASSFSRWIRIIGQFFNEFTLKCLKEKPADQAPLCVSPSATPQNTTEREMCRQITQTRLHTINYFIFFCILQFKTQGIDMHHRFNLEHTQNHATMKQITS